MPWNMNDYPSSLKNLSYAARKKAIDIANAMVNAGYDENRAIPIATKQAEEWYEDAGEEEVREFEKQVDPTERDDGDERYASRPEMLDKNEHVVPHEDGWAVESKDAKQPSDVYSRKQDAIDRGREIASNKGTCLTIHKQDGTIEKKIQFEQ